MKTHIFALFCLLANVLFAQNIQALRQKHSDWQFNYQYEKTPFIHVSAIGKMGFSTPKTPLIYEEIGKKSMNFAAAMKNGHWGLIDVTGKEVGKWDYDKLDLIENYQEDFATQDWATAKNGQEGRIRFNGKEIFLPEYDKIVRIDEGYLVQKNKQWGIADTNGVFIKPIEYEDIIRKNTLFFVKKEGKYGVIDRQSMKQLLPILYDWIQYGGGYFSLTLEKKEGLANAKGEVLFPPIHQAISINMPYILVSDSSFRRFVPKKEEEDMPRINMTTCSQDTATVRIWAMYDTLKRQVFPPKYESISLWGKQDTFEVGLNGKGGLINLKQEVLLPLEYDEINEIPGNKIATLKGDKQAIQTIDGKVLQQDFEMYFIKFLYCQPQVYIWLYKDKKVQMLDTTGKVAYEYAFDFNTLHGEDYRGNPLEQIEHDVTMLLIDGVYHYILPNGKLLFKSPQKTEMIAFQDKYVMENYAIKGKKAFYTYTFFDGNGKVLYKWENVAKISFLDFYESRGNLFPIAKNEKYGYFDLKTGKLQIPFQFQYASIFDAGEARVTDAADREFFIDSTGKEIIRHTHQAHLPFEEASAHNGDGIVREDGELIIPLNYDDIWATKNYFFTQKGETYYVFDLQGKAKFSDYKVLGADGDLFRLKNKEGVGIMDLQGKIHIPFVYEEIRALNGYRYMAKKKGKWALISPHNEVFTGYDFSLITPLNGNAYWVQKAKKWTLIDSVGRVLSPLKFTKVDLGRNSSFIDIVQQQDKWAVIKDDGTLLSPFQESVYKSNFNTWEKPFDVVDDAIIVRENGKSYFITSENAYLSEQMEEEEIFTQYYAQTSIHTSQVYDSVYIYPGGCTSPDHIFRNGYAKVSNNALWGLANREGKEVVKPIYQIVVPGWGTSDYFLLIKKDGTQDLFFPNKALLINTQYRNIGGFYKGLATYTSDNKLFGYIDTLGNVAIPAQYEVAENFSDYGMAVVKMGGQVGLIDTKGKWLISPQYEAISIVNKANIIVKKDCKFYLYGVDNQLLSKEYDMINMVYRTTFFSVLQGDKSGLIDSVGKEIVPCQFEKIANYNDYKPSEIPPHFQFVIEAEKKGVWDTKKQKLILPCIYENVKWVANAAGKDYFIASRNEKAGVIDENNEIILPFEYTPAYNGGSVTKDGKELYFNTECKCFKANEDLNTRGLRESFYWGQRE